MATLQDAFIAPDKGQPTIPTSPNQETKSNPLDDFASWLEAKAKGLEEDAVERKYGGAFGKAGTTNAATYDQLSKNVNSFDGTTLIINGTEIKAKQGLMYEIRDKFGPNSEPTVSSINDPSLSGKLKSAASSAASSTLGAFETGGNAVLGGANALGGAVSGAMSGVQSGLQGGIDAVGGAVMGGINSGISAIGDYCAPLSRVLSGFELLMKAFDDWIATTWIGQIFGIKGSEIICTVFCIIISFLPCKTRNKLYEIMMAIKATEAAFQDGLKFGIDLTTTYNESIVDAQDVVSATSKLFGTYKGKPLTSNTDGTNRLNEVMGVPSYTGKKTNAPSKPQWSRAALQAPKEIKTIVETITKAIKFITKCKITLPVGINGNIWDLAQAILYAIQTMAIQLANEFLNKVVAKIEEWIKKMIPDNCLSNMAMILFNKIIATIRKFKQWLLSLLKELFGASNGFSIQWKTFGLNINWLLQLLNLLIGLNLGLSKFADLLLACGLTPCKDGQSQTPNLDVFPTDVWQPQGPDGTEWPINSPLKWMTKPLTSKQADILNQVNQKNVLEALKNGRDIPMTNIPAARLPWEDRPMVGSARIDDIAMRLAPIVQLPMEAIIVTPQELKFITPGFRNMPKKIAELVAAGFVEQNLGPGWTTYVSPDGKNMDAVYTFKRSCGD